MIDKALDLAAAAGPCATGCDAISKEIHQLSESLGRAIDAKDHHTRLHSEEVAVVGRLLALAMGLSGEQAEHVHIAGHLHDIGKIGIPDRLLDKPGRLTPEEFRQIRRHPVIGADILRPVTFLASSGIADMVYHHHERFDGRGYPDRLEGFRIPLGARVLAVADSLSAMLQDRPYRRRMPFDQAMEEIRLNSGKMYDPLVVEVTLSEAALIQSTLEQLKQLHAHEQPAWEPPGSAGRVGRHAPS